MKENFRGRVLHEEAGITLVEMMVTIMVMITVLFALYSIFDMSIRVFSFGNDKVEATENARLGMEKMEREIRAAYPVDRIAGRQHVFFAPGFSATAARPGDQNITFGNDLPAGGTPPNRMVDAEEEISYELRLSSNINNACPTSGTDGVCTLVRRKGPVATAAFQPVVEYVVPNGLTFGYYRNRVDSVTGGLQTATAATGTDIHVVRIKLQINVDDRRQNLTTDVDLRNRG